MIPGLIWVNQPAIVKEVEIAFPTITTNKRVAHVKREGDRYVQEPMILKTGDIIRQENTTVRHAHEDKINQNR